MALNLSSIKLGLVQILLRRTLPIGVSGVSKQVLGSVEDEFLEKFSSLI